MKSNHQATKTAEMQHRLDSSISISDLKFEIRDLSTPVLGLRALVVNVWFSSERIDHV